jgi:hypothetical protein
MKNDLSRIINPLHHFSSYSYLLTPPERKLSILPEKIQSNYLRRIFLQRLAYLRAKQIGPTAQKNVKALE